MADVRQTTDHWAVTVEWNGQNIVTIESNCLSGREIDEEDERVIRIAAAHLLAFIGDSPLVVPVVADLNDGEANFSVSDRPDSIVQKLGEEGRLKPFPEDLKKRHEERLRQSEKTASIYYAVGLSRRHGIGFDIGEFGTFREAVATAIEYGAVAPDTCLIDAAEITFRIDGSGDSIWVQRFPK